MTILAAVDLSPISVNAAASAARLARKLDERLLVVRVLESVSIFYPELSLAGVPDIDGPLRKANEEALENIKAALGDEGIEIETRLLSGAAAAALAKCAREEDARLIVMGTHGRGPSARLLAGSVAQRTVLEAPCPVLVMREGTAPFDEWVQGKRPLRILVGVDRLPATEAALSWVSRLREAGPCDVTLVHEYWPPAEHTRLGLHGPRELGETDSEVAAILERELAAHARGLPGEGRLALQVKASWGRVADSLADEAEAQHADLLVVGTHQPHVWERLKTGSTALSTLHVSKTPVLCVPGRLRRADALASAAPIPTFRSVLVATDLSELGNAAVPHAYALLRASGGAVELCHVHEGSLASQAHLLEDRRGGLSEVRRRELELKLRDLVPRQAAELGIATRVTVIDGGSAAAEITRAAQRLGVDAIVVASHGRSGIGRALLGSVAEAVLRGSDKPVHVVRGRP